ncbi:PR domain zinc finger protein 10-like [Homalodisca vitripennis]|uniref:PR domain zinc finger protein 10-like n=1 Tax=Homalodisca vitripennis TaxID=197043 RepID=UPI001EEB3081|nr:PR domain zinc finger protein 10-like [Homalodisca vitripennis]
MPLIKIHDCSVQWECPMCKQQFSNVLALRSHVHSHAIDDGLYHCPHCEKEFEELQWHTQTHPSFPLCAQVRVPGLWKNGFPPRTSYACILLKHSDHREFLCADCGKQFKRKDKLKEHMKRLHSSDIVS